MTKIIKLIFLLINFMFFAELSVFSQTLSYEDVLNSAIKNSFELKMSAVDIGISKSQLKAARSDLYPALSLQYNTEYNKDLTEGRSSFSYAGNTMITPYTQYRNMLYMTLSYNLFDFGVTGKKIHIAKKELEQKKVSYDLQLKDLKLNVLDTYTKILQSHNEIKVKTEVLKLYENIFNNKERMFKAGLNDKISVMDEAVKIAKMQNDIETSKLQLKNSLEDLSYFTSQKYDPQSLDIKHIEDKTDENIVPVNYTEPFKTSAVHENYEHDFDPDLSDEAKYYDLEIEKKKSELSILKRQLLPSFRLYTGYSLYGQNPNQYFNSMNDIRQRSYVIGVSSTYVFFDGFKNRANREKTILEINKLNFEKEKRLADLKKNYEKSFQSYESYNEELKIKKDVLLTVKDKLYSINKLSLNKLADNNDLLMSKAELLMEEYELEKNIINISSKIEEMKIMTGEDVLCIQD